MIYKCQKCSKTFSQKSNYNVHINRKFSCIKENNIIIPSEDIILKISDQIDKNKLNTTENHQKNILIHNTIISKQISTKDKLEILCEFCKTSFCRKDVLLKHIKKNCKIKKIFDEKQLTETKINNEIDELKKEIENLKKQITIISNKKL